MDPQLKSIVTSIIMTLSGSIATLAVSEGVIPLSQHDSAANIIISVTLYVVTALLALYKRDQHSPQAQIDAINEPPNGLKVVPAGVDVPAVTTPLKALALLFAAGLALLALGGVDARADSADLIAGLKANPIKLPIPLPTSGAGLLAGLNSKLTTVFDDLANWVGGDLTDAEALATQNPNLQDWTGYACWKAAENFTAVLKAHPVPLTLKLATDGEALRLAIAAAHQLCQTSACQTVSGDVLGGIAQMGLGMPAPVTLQTLCAKIPSITLGTQPVGYVAPTPAPSPTASPTP